MEIFMYNNESAGTGRFGLYNERNVISSNDRITDVSRDEHEVTEQSFSLVLDHILGDAPPTECVKVKQEIHVQLLVQSSCAQPSHSAASGFNCQSSCARQIPNKNEFFRGFCLTPVRSTSVPAKSAVDVDYGVIIIDDDDDEDLGVHSLEDSEKSGVPTSTKVPRIDRRSAGDGLHKTFPQSNRLRRLLALDLSSPLGRRVSSHLENALKKGGDSSLMPCTVAHTLSGVNNTLSYELFCRTPVKAAFSGRLRDREFPVRFPFRKTCGGYCHRYCFGRADRLKFCLRYDTGLNAKSRRLQRFYSNCSVSLDAVTDDEITDWRSSKRLVDYVAKMQEKEAARLLAANHVEDEVIAVSSDSEDDEPAQRVAAKPEALVFRCHKCGAEIACGARFRELVRCHYSVNHNLHNIDLVSVRQPDGKVTFNVVQVVQQKTTDSNSHTPACLSSSARPTATVSQAATTPFVSSTNQVPWPQFVRSSGAFSRAGNIVRSSLIRPQLLVTGGTPVQTVPRQNVVFRYDQPLPTSPPLRVQGSMVIPCIRFSSSSLQTVPRQLFANNFQFIGSSLCSRSAATSNAAVLPSAPCDADVICLD